MVLRLGEPNMALADNLELHNTKGPAKANRLSLLLARLEGTEDHGVLMDAIRSDMRHVAITKALRTEYGNDVVTDTSVREYRLRMNREVTGL